MKSLFLITLLMVSLVPSSLINVASASAPPTLTNLTIWGQSPVGQLTFYYWDTNSLSGSYKVGVMSSGVFQNQGSAQGNLGEISIPLQEGLNSFSLFADSVGSQPYFGLVLFFNGAAISPQIAVYNVDGGSGPSFAVQPAGSIVGLATGAPPELGGMVPSPVSSSFEANGFMIELVSFTISSSSSTNIVRDKTIGPDGLLDMTGAVVLNVYPIGPVAPEYAFGALLAVAACFAAFAVIKRPKINLRRK